MIKIALKFVRTYLSLQKGNLSLNLQLLREFCMRWSILPQKQEACRIPDQFHVEGDFMPSSLSSILMQV